MRPKFRNEANLTQATTSGAVEHRAISVGRQSIIALKICRAAS